MDGQKNRNKEEEGRQDRETNDGLDPIREGGRAGRAKVSGRASAREESHYPKAAAAALLQKRKN